MTSASLLTTMCSGTGLVGYLKFHLALKVFKAQLVVLLVFSGTSPLISELASSSLVEDFNHADLG